MPFEFKKLEIPDVILIKPPRVFEDERGFFMETYKKPDFEKAGIKGEFVQDNHSRSKYGVLRGLHFQREPYAQAKIVRCVRGGVIYDVAVDLRKNSPTFGKYVGVILSEFNKYQLYIPRGGFAHGFVVLSDVAEVVYKVDNVYAPDHEGGLIWNDPDVGIKWPVEDPIISPKDQKWPTLRELIERGWVF
ncbi:dTDP-4-dehydrorhamnose 3,5-epimerase [Thermococcus peptonophilus]|uniref:dTDP-4-dehydrorhamnose 3,5-epimerase n=1 Tax=Thermococcus peptonophilus TaxID=53952 RepID=UPI0006D16FAB